MQHCPVVTLWDLAPETIPLWGLLAVIPHAVKLHLDGCLKHARIIHFMAVQLATIESCHAGENTKNIFGFEDNNIERLYTYLWP